MGGGTPRPAEYTPVIVIDHLDDAERRALTIALSRLAETGTWDEEALALEFEELVDIDVDVISTGFELAEIDALLIESADNGHALETVPQLPEVAVSQIGDLGTARKDQALRKLSSRRLLIRRDSEGVENHRW